MTFALFSVLAQIPPSSLAGDEPRIVEPSSILTLLLAGLFGLFVFLIAMKTSRRNLAKE